MPAPTSSDSAADSSPTYPRSPPSTQAPSTSQATFVDVPQHIVDPHMDKAMQQHTGLPLPATAQRPDNTPSAGQKMVHTVPLAWHTKVGSAWRAFARKVREASLSESVTAGSTVNEGASGSVVLGRMAPRTAGPVIERDMVEKRSPVAGTARNISNLGTRPGALPTTQADDDEVDEKGQMPTVEMLVLDQGFSSSAGWARKLGHGAQMGYHPSAPTDDNPAMEASRTYSATDGLHVGDDEVDAGCWGKTRIGTLLRWRVWPMMYHFFEMPYITGKEEHAYQKEAWYTGKRVALWGCSIYWLLLITALTFAIRPLDIVVLMGIQVAELILVVLLPLMIIFDFPKKHRLIYQVWLFCATWSYVYVGMGDIEFCGYYSDHNVCGKKDFTGMMFSAIALPSIAMLGMGMTRIFYAIGAAGFIGLGSWAGAKHATSWQRNLVNFFFYSIALLIVHRMKESNDRRMWSLRDQLKKQFKATQKAQVAEAKAADSKRRFTSYVFHEIRVPLNTALLALQNLENAGVFSLIDKNEGDHTIEWNALVGSCVMVQKVLNDVLDFSRMDAGRFETVWLPFHFHRSLRSLHHSLESAAVSKGLEFEVDLDPRIDEVLLRAAQQAAQLRGEDYQHLTEGAAVGDEMRLRQIITNLCSNATKFTPVGGRVSLRTRLIYPTPSPSPPTSSPDTPRLSTHLRELSGNSVVNTVVVRIEIEDTGEGISAADLNDARLFSPFVQTEIGVRHGGKGSGLGLAIVRSIVKHSKGRLGLISTKGQGSTFWLEIPLGAGQQAVSLEPNASQDVIGSSYSAHPVRTPQPPSEKKTSSKVARFVLENGQVPGLVSDVKRPPETGVEIGLSTPDDHMGRFQLPIFVSGDGQPATLVTALTSPRSFVHRPALCRSDGSGQSTSSKKNDESKLLDPADHSSRQPSNQSRAELTLLPTPESEISRRIEPENSNLSQKCSPTTSESNEEDFTNKYIKSDSGRPPLSLPLPIKTTFDTKEIQTTIERPFFSAALSDSPVGGGGAGASSSTTTTEGKRLIGSTSTAPGSASGSTQIEPLRILLVDDDALTRKLMMRMLTRQGHMCSEAFDGLDALIKLGACSQDGSSDLAIEDVMKEEHSFDLIMLDNYMPSISGVAVIRRLRKFNRRDMVCGCTANAEKGDQEEYKEAGVDALLTKPINQRDLMRMCAEADTRRKNRMALSTLTNASVTLDSPTILRAENETR